MFLMYVTFSESLILLRKALQDISHDHALPQGWIFFLLLMGCASTYNQPTSTKALSEITKLLYQQFKRDWRNRAKDTGKSIILLC